jgi:hypothetical protein
VKKIIALNAKETIVWQLLLVNAQKDIMMMEFLMIVKVRKLILYKKND